MRRITIFLIITSICLFTSAAPKRERTPNAVNEFINNLETFTRLSDNQRDDAYRLNERNYLLFAGGGNSKGGINIDTENRYNSELYYLGLTPVSNSLRYCNQLYTLLYKEKSLKLTHEILYTEAINAPDIDGKDELYFYDTKVKKTCAYNNNQSKIIWQTFEVGASNGLIDKIEGLDTRPSSWSCGNADNTNTVTPNQPNQNVYETPNLDDRPETNTPQRSQEVKQSEQDLLRIAARYYTAKDYSSASSTLNQLTTKYPNNAEAWFRLALIVRYKTKWSKKVYKDPKKSAIEFMKKASALATGKLKSKTDNALFYWEHPDYM